MIVLPYMIIYVTKDRERAEGMPENERYSILSGDGTESTLELLQNSNLPKDSNILVFKNSIQIEKLCREKKWRLLNPSAILSEKIENKITQTEWLGDLTNFLPEHSITITKNINEKYPFIIQWAHSHTGDGTLYIQRENELQEIIRKFPEREVRLTKYIKGPMFTMNIVVRKDDILLGNISYQITGISPFTENPMSTIGNDWSLPHSILSKNHIKEFNNIALTIGKKMQPEGWKGLFGIDVIYDEERDKLFLIEINARQPASATYESQLQAEARGKGVSGITIFEAHLSALTNQPISSKIIEINDGAQIIQRVTSKITDIEPVDLANAGYKVIKYMNTKLNSDLLRIQSKLGIMESHDKFNKRGKEIEEQVEELVK